MLMALPVADANSSVSFNGGTSFTDGQWFDWLRLGSANVASATTAGNALGTNFSGQRLSRQCDIRTYQPI